MIVLFAYGGDMFLNLHPILATVYTILVAAGLLAAFAATLYYAQLFTQGNDSRPRTQTAGKRWRQAHPGRLSHAGI